MTDAINTNNRLKAPGTASNNQAKSPAKEPSTRAAGSPASAVVELTSDQLLKEMERLPEVNNKRIETIKNALTSGEYRPDPEIVARKYSEIEKLLP